MLPLKNRAGFDFASILVKTLSLHTYILLPMDDTGNITLDQRYADADVWCEWAFITVSGTREYTSTGPFTPHVSANAECAHNVRHWQCDADGNADAGKIETCLILSQGMLPLR